VGVDLATKRGPTPDGKEAGGRVRPLLVARSTPTITWIDDLTKDIFTIQ
jgi:hypothetical protein